MNFPWTTVASILDDFQKKVDDLEELSESLLVDAELKRRRALVLEAQAHDNEKDSKRATSVATKIQALIS